MRFTPSSRCSALTLVEVAIAVGIVAFCLIAIVGLLPVMLEAVRSAREKGMTSRILEAVVRDVRDNKVSAGASRTYEFNDEGFLLRVTSGAVPSSDTALAFYARVSAQEGVIPDASGNGKVLLSKVSIVNTVRNKLLLNRPMWSENE